MNLVEKHKGHKSKAAENYIVETVCFRSCDIKSYRPPLEFGDSTLQ